jgi:pimeloyl-ACP methyl ester carboxylesterase
VRANGIRFAYLAEGPPEGPLALCLHGFPDHAGTWRHLLPMLADAGFHAVAPWMRGIPPTDVPVERRVDPDVLTADVNALHRALGGDRRAVVIGHDWGAIGASRAAAAAPELWRRVVTLAVPPERALAGIWHDRRQVARSWYALAAQVPGLGERMVTDPRRLERLWRAWSPGYEPTVEDLAPLHAVVGDPQVRRAMLATYRGLGVAMVGGRAVGGRVPVPPQPHLVLHGEDDGCIGVEHARAAAALLRHPASRVTVVPDTGHWLHLEAPEEVGRAISAFVSEGHPAGSAGTSAVSH